MKKLYTIFQAFFFMMILAGCSRKSASVSQSAMALRVALESQENSLLMLDKISVTAAKADSLQKINHETNEDIQNYLVEERQKIEGSKQKLKAAQADLQDFGEKKGTKKEAEVVAAANHAVQESADILRILEKKTEVIVDFLGSETFSKSEIGALFRPGEYNLVKEQVQEGKRLFDPIVSKLFVFAEKYKGSFSSMKGQIIVTGYSDATAVEKGPGLFKDLSSRLSENDGITEPTQQDLNQKLSELRAGAVRELLIQIISEHKQKESNPLDISVNILGRGEELPPGLQKEATKNDHRRRVVTFYWVVLPTL